VDTNGLPVHLALTPGEAHDNGPTFHRNGIAKTRSASARICIARAT
jgi:hypothetical protein